MHATIASKRILQINILKKYVVLSALRVPRRLKPFRQRPPCKNSKCCFVKCVKRNDIFDICNESCGIILCRRSVAGRLCNEKKQF